MRVLLLLLVGLVLASAADEGYRLFPGDLLRVSVFDNPDLSVDLRVTAEGPAPYPLVGPLAPLAGRTAEAVRSELTVKLADGYLRNPVVTATVAEFAPRTAWIIGAVRKPGAVRLDPLRITTALQAIGEAGGFDDDANRGGAQVVRAETALPIAAVGQAADIPLTHGDVIVVPRTDRIYVLGQVQRPGALALPANERLTVSKAVSLAGGFDRFAQERRVQLVRPGQAVLSVDVRALLDGRDGVSDPELRPGDTVFVPESRF